jgi:2-iminoacetate synthase
MNAATPQWLAVQPWVRRAHQAGPDDVRAAIGCASPGARELAVLLSAAAAPQLEAMARRALALTRSHFGNTVSLYAPLYLSNYCSGGGAYCGVAADRKQPRYRLSPGGVREEVAALKQLGFEDVLLLTGERCPQADFEYLRQSVALAAAAVHNVSVESFAMTEEEYRALVAAGCVSMTLYQETYDADLYAELHRWGPKQDYAFRLDAPARALAAGLRMVGVGALIGLAEPVTEMLRLFLHVEHLRKTFWRSGVMISFPRLRPQRGEFVAPHPVSDRQLAQFIYAFRICLPDVPLVLSTRESPRFRDGMAGVGIARMSAGSRTTVGGYRPENEGRTNGQFAVHDTRDVTAFCAMLKAKGLEPVFKNWDAVFQEAGTPSA